MVVTETPVDLRSALKGKTAFESGEKVPEAILSFERWREATSKGDPAADLRAQDLERAGRAAALGLMIMGRERQY